MSDNKLSPPAPPVFKSNDSSGVSGGVGSTPQADVSGGSVVQSVPAGGSGSTLSPTPSVSDPVPAAPIVSATPISPVTPVAEPASPVSGTPVISSRFLNELQSVNPTPFRDPGTTGNSTSPAPLVSGSVPQSVGPSMETASIPQETAGFSPVMAASGGGKSASPVVPTAQSGGSSPLSRLAGIPKKTLMMIGAAVLLLVLFLGGFFWWQGRNDNSTIVGNTGNSSPAPVAQKSVELTYWGLWEPASVMQPLIDEYQKQNPGVKITYVQQKSDQYRARLQAAIRDGSGPDMFRFHNTWMPMVQGDIAPAPRTVLAASVLENEFFPVVSKDFVRGNQVYGVPLMYEGMALLYNQSLLEAANAQPPSDWEQVRQLATQLTIRQEGRLERAGVALGNTTNVDNFSDILATMMLQNSADPGNPSTENANHALEFYTIFFRTDQVWNDTMPSSTQAFANEQVAMIFVPSWRIFEIQRQNPNIKIGVARMPQLSGTPVTWASYWAESVSKNSKNQEEAWKFLAYLSKPEQMRRFHSLGASQRGFGELYPRVDLAKELSNNELLKPYLDDALYAQSWSLASMTHDEGLNDQLIQYYTDAVNVMNTQNNAERAFRQILPGLQQVFSRYGITVSGLPTPTPAPQGGSL